MSIGNQLLGDLARMYENGPPQLGARVSYDPDVLAEVAFRDRHGMTRAQWQERERIRARQDFETRAVANIEQELDAITATGVTARKRFEMFHACLVRERDKLAELESRRDGFQGLVAAPAVTQNKIRDAVAATKKWLLGGGDEPAICRQALDAELASATHRAQAAAEAIAEVDAQIEVARLRGERLAEAEKEFLHAAVREVVETSGLLQVLARKRGEVRALERLLGSAADYYGYGNSVNVEPEHVEMKWRHSWHEIAEAIRENPTADIAKLLPKVPT
jgi:hypothetical protein